MQIANEPYRKFHRHANIFFFKAIQDFLKVPKCNRKCYRKYKHTFILLKINA